MGVLTCLEPLEAWTGVVAPHHLTSEAEMRAFGSNLGMAAQRTLASTERPSCSRYKWRAIELDPDINVGFLGVPSCS